jgi:transcription termination/antitermination protein NusG
MDVALMNKKWYVIHTQTGQEDRVRMALEKKRELETEDGGRIGQVLIPTERVSEIREGQKRITERKFFPGYVLVEMDMDERTWYLVRTTSGVTGFIGAGRKKPLPLNDEEIQQILNQTVEGQDKPSPKIVFHKGEPVRVTEGPFTNFNGVIEEVDPERGKLKVSVSIFGRATPVELEYWQVEKS